MNPQKEFIQFIKYGYKRYLPTVSIECVIFGYNNQQLKVLIGKYAPLNQWGLPGGFVKKEETLSKAAARILKELTCLDDIYLQQFYTFGDSDARFKSLVDILNLPDEIKMIAGEDNWLLQRRVSVGYFALIDFAKAAITPNFINHEFSWHPVSEVPELLFDHNEMVEKALETMRNQIYHQPIGYNLLPEKFTLPEIHTLYETILNKKLDRRNFSNKLMSLDILIKLDEKRKIGQHRSPFLYKFDEEKYQEALENGVALAL
jgi:ADP-ribose pyrophosphatase YjhB (NUDIX family)